MFRKLQAIGFASLFLIMSPGYAQNASWDGTYRDGNMVDPDNWQPIGVPTGMATFDSNSPPHVDLNPYIAVDRY